MNQTAWDDTIVAIATPAGIGALGVIRLSGSKAIDIANKVFHSKDLEKVKTHTLHVGFVKDGERAIDEVVLSLFRAPKSYTGEDVVEISCHGSNYILEQVMDVLVRNGARLAKAGEFTQRAFLQGKMDLAQAESVADMIASNTEASHNAAMNAMRGGFSEKLKDLREQLIKFSALIELELDFSQEDVAFADRSAFEKLIEELLSSTGQLIQSFKLGNVIRNGVSVAIIGKPNAGKSTLLNALLNENRAIVSEIPGTTRDTIEEILNIDGILFRLIDTAGIREHSNDLIENQGMERSVEKMKAADLVVYLYDVNDDHNETDRERIKMQQLGLKFLMVGNKVDASEKSPSTIQSIFISAKEGSNLDELRDAMVNAVLDGKINSENTIVTNLRHYQALKEAHFSLEEIRAGLMQNIPGDLLSLDIRRALSYLGEITGQVNNEEMLDYIFSKFCIGK